MQQEGSCQKEALPQNLCTLAFDLGLPSFQNCRNKCCSSHPIYECFFVSLFRARVSLCSPGCPGTHYGDQPAWNLEILLLPLPPKCWD
ncbi:hypothetical protein I79_010210 [Cricetulus griseus]|uniref:Uncharacterized protein n=1 Tax=Cricetulus griseus TaxID=10029 RepID=G3HHV1_CRIGR|nr:hypothetical protein I79_010210 [Cricetulus griseus]